MATISLATEKLATLVSEPSILGRGRRLESPLEETMDGFEEMATSFHEVYREREMFFQECRQEQEARWRRMDAKFNELKLILGLNFPNKGRATATMDEDSGSHELQKTEELGILRSLPHVEGPGSDSLESHDGGWYVQRTTVMVDVDSESETYPIMAIFDNNKEEVNDIEVEPSVFNSGTKSRGGLFVGGDFCAGVG